MTTPDRTLAHANAHRTPAAPHGGHARIRAFGAGLRAWLLGFALPLLLVSNLSTLDAQTVSLADALDAADLLWTTGGDAPWLGQTTTTHDRRDAAQSGILANGQSSWIETTIAGPGSVSFWWKVSSQTDSDPVIVYNNDVEQGRISGERDWAQSTIWLEPGPNLVRWAYAKDADGGAGQDSAWVDRVAVFTLRGAWHEAKVAIGRANDVFAANGLAYVAVSGEQGEAGLAILDVRNPANPVWVGGYAEASSANAVKVVDDLAYVVDTYNGLEILDVSDPTTPTRIGGFKAGWSHSAIEVIGNRAYLFKPFGLSILDVGDPANPIELGMYPKPYLSAVRVVENIAYLASSDGLTLVDVSAPAKPVQIGQYLVDDVQDLAVSGGFAYLPTWYAGLHILDVSNPAAPLLASVVKGGSQIVDVVGNRAYVGSKSAQGSDGLKILDVSDPTSPVELGHFAGTLGPRALQVAASVAYVADQQAGMQLVDIGNPANPAWLGDFDTETIAYSLDHTNDVVYLADGFSGVQVLDVSDPDQPRQVGSYESAGLCAFDVQVECPIAYVAGGKAGLEIVDVSPAQRSVLAGAQKAHSYQ